MSDFYVGYQPSAPVNLGRRIRSVVMGLFALATVLAGVFVTGQHPFAAAFFEYGRLQEFQGDIQLRPYPILWLKRLSTEQPLAYLLVAPGKHGADSLVREFDGRQVRLQGELIHRGPDKMIQVLPGSIRETSAEPADEPPAEDLGIQTITGEIVDTKCYLGVMNPGEGKVHRDCAARCISGGIPPALVSNGAVYLLAAADEKTKADLRRRAGERVLLQGRLTRQNGSLTLFLSF